MLDYASHSHPDWGLSDSRNNSGGKISRNRSPRSSDSKNECGGKSFRNLSLSDCPRYENFLSIHVSTVWRTTVYPNSRSVRQSEIERRAEGHLKMWQHHCIDLQTLLSSLIDRGLRANTKQCQSIWRRAIILSAALCSNGRLLHFTLQYNMCYVQFNRNAIAL